MWSAARDTLLAVLLVLLAGGGCRKATEPTLKDRLAHPDHVVRLAAIAAVGKQGSTGAWAVPALTRLLADKDPSVCVASARVLGGLGPRAAPAARALSSTPLALASWRCGA